MSKVAVARLRGSARLRLLGCGVSKVAVARLQRVRMVGVARVSVVVVVRLRGKQGCGC